MSNVHFKPNVSKTEPLVCPLTNLLHPVAFSQWQQHPPRCPEQTLGIILDSTPSLTPPPIHQQIPEALLSTSTQKLRTYHTSLLPPTPGPAPITSALEDCRSPPASARDPQQSTLNTAARDIL